MSEKAQQAAQRDVERIVPKNDLVAVIPAGGLGGQMYPVTSGMPKALLPLGTKPLLVKILAGLDASVFSKAIVLCNEWYEMISSYLNAFGSELRVTVECRQTDKRPPDCLKELQAQGRLTDPFLFHYCDVLIKKPRWKQVCAEYEDKAKDGIVAMLLGSRCYDYSVGIMSIDRNHWVSDFLQKPEDMIHGYANCAVSLLGEGFVQRYINCNEIDIYNKGGAIHRAIKDRKVASYEVADWHHLQQIRDWLKAQKEWYPHIPF
jgi:NDP-sugar pyrophosphorylase family protein